MFDQVLWFATRGAGIVSLLLSTAVVCLGLMTALRFERRAWPRFLTVELHRSIALVSVIFVAIHVVSAVLDPFTELGIFAALIPLASTYRPLDVAFGVISVYLVLAVLLTSLIRDRLSQRTWRAVHWLAYAAWPMAVFHSITAGSDAFAPWMLAIVATCCAAVGALLVWRWSVVWPGRRELADVVDRSSIREEPVKRPTGRTAR
jgi:sulfoxide reductase heme-binding subunit YedZ